MSTSNPKTKFLQILSPLKGDSPRIGENGNWFVGEEDTGVAARGEPGITPHIGENGNWFVGEKDTGVKAGGSSDGSGGVSFDPGNALELKDGKLSVKTTDVAEADNTLPITSAGVNTIVGNISAILDTI